MEECPKKSTTFEIYLIKREMYSVPSDPHVLQIEWKGMTGKTNPYFYKITGKTSFYFQSFINLFYSRDKNMLISPHRVLTIFKYCCFTFMVGWATGRERGAAENLKCHSWEMCSRYLMTWYVWDIDMDLCYGTHEISDIIFVEFW